MLSASHRTEAASSSFGTRRFVICLALLGVYFTGLLIPVRWPALTPNAFFFLYVLSIPLSLILLSALGVWGLVGTARAYLQGLSISSKHRALIALPLAGFLMFGSAVWLARTIPRVLPPGSNLLPFDSAVWRDDNSTSFVAGDISQRQKMLGSLIERLTPELNRADLEALLGPSLNTAYFESNGRDLIYRLGPERDSWLSIDSEWLLIWLDERGQFRRYSISTD